MSFSETCRNWTPPQGQLGNINRAYWKVANSRERWQARTAKFIQRKLALRAANRRMHRRVGLSIVGI